MNGFLILSGILCLLAAAVGILRISVSAPEDGERVWSERPDVRARRDAEKERARQEALRHIRHSNSGDAGGAF